MNGIEFLESIKLFVPVVTQILKILSHSLIFTSFIYGKVGFIISDEKTISNCLSKNK